MRRLLAALLVPALACSGVFGGSSDQGTTTTHVPSTSGEPTPVVMPDDYQSTDDCGDLIETPAPQGFAVGRIECGQTIQASNNNGTEFFGDDFYVYHFCSPQRHDYDDSPEVAYQLTVPADKKATVFVNSDCAQVDVAIMSWDDPRSPPTTNGRRLNECEMRPKRDSTSVATVTVPQEYMVVVDGRNGSVGNFTLTVECKDYR
jgi:hypothetical protein